MIEWIMLLDKTEMVVHYSSGCNRYVFPDELGDYEPYMTKTQRDFMKNSIKGEEKLSDDRLVKTLSYWLNKDNSNKAMMDILKIKEKLYRINKATN